MTITICPPLPHSPKCRQWAWTHTYRWRSHAKDGVDKSAVRRKRAVHSHCWRDSSSRQCCAPWRATLWGWSWTCAQVLCPGGTATSSAAPPTAWPRMTDVLAPGAAGPHHAPLRSSPLPCPSLHRQRNQQVDHTGMVNILSSTASLCLHCTLPAGKHFYFHLVAVHSMFIF